jgi:GTP-binding protein EngB required for normal cell division
MVSSRDPDTDQKKRNGRSPVFLRFLHGFFCCKLLNKSLSSMAAYAGGFGENMRANAKQSAQMESNNKPRGLSKNILLIGASKAGKTTLLKCLNSDPRDSMKTIGFTFSKFDVQIIDSGIMNTQCLLIDSIGLEDESLPEIGLIDKLAESILDIPIHCIIFVVDGKSNLELTNSMKMIQSLFHVREQKTQCLIYLSKLEPVPQADPQNAAQKKAQFEQLHLTLCQQLLLTRINGQQILVPNIIASGFYRGGLMTEQEKRHNQSLREEIWKILAFVDGQTYTTLVNVYTSFQYAISYIPLIPRPIPSTRVFKYTRSGTELDADDNRNLMNAQN